MAQSSKEMADKPHKNHNDNNKEHQPLLVLGPPFMFPIFEAQNLHNYHFLNAFSSFKTFLLLIMLGNGILLSPAIFLLAPSPQNLSQKNDDLGLIHRWIVVKFEHHVCNPILSILTVGNYKIMSELRGKPFAFKECDNSLPFLPTQSIQTILCSPRQKISADFIGLLPLLSLIMTSSAGTDHIDLVECSRHGIQVVSVPGDQAKDVADMAVGLLIDVLWKISAADRHVRKWGLSMPQNLSFGIVGLGKIGKEVAKRLEAFDCRIMYHSRNEKPFILYPFYSNVVELAGNSDVLVFCCPLNEQTRHIINREVMLGKDGVIVNVGRGSLIDEKELVWRLMEEEIRDAGLDLFENEPNVPNELFPLDNVVLSPHAASLTSDGFTEVCELAAEALEVFFSSKLPSTQVLDD
ncbi:Glyoxylate/hydroxypyruvate reductase HPR3 [Glycine soja]